MTQHGRDDARSGGASGTPRGFGDGQGTRVGKPTAPPPDEPGHDLADDVGHEGASGQAPEEGRPVRGDAGIKGRDVARNATGAGDQAAEGLNAVGGRAPQERSAIDGRAEGHGVSAAGVNRSGSEPLRDRDESIAEDYGGKGGKPRPDVNVAREVHEEKEVEEVREPHHGNGWERSSVTGNRPSLRQDDAGKRKG